MSVELCLEINGEQLRRSVPPNQTLADFLREDLGLTGTKIACGTGDCGACTVILDGSTVTSCLVLALEVAGGRVTTVEGLTPDGAPSVIQEELVASGGVQCGFCTPGFVVAAHALLAENPHPTEQEIRAGLAGNICRCTGYMKILEAVKNASLKMAS
jgi:aerobic carbon-monoxide dehydrogenase small subunit